MKIHYERTFRIAQYESERIGFEYDTQTDGKIIDTYGRFGENEPIVDALRKMAEQAFVGRYPHLKDSIPSYPKNKEPIVPQVEPKENIPVIQRPRGDKLVDAINNCRTEDDLASLWLLLDSDEAEIAYLEKMAQLKNK